jgi:hypothetical protein
VPDTTHDAVVPVLDRVQVAFAGMFLAGEHNAVQTVPTTVLMQLVGQVARVRLGGAAVHTASNQAMAGQQQGMLLTIGACWQAVPSQRALVCVGFVRTGNMLQGRPRGMQAA